MNRDMRRLLGTWRSDPSDLPGEECYGQTTLKFGADGTLLYISHEDDHDDVIRLTFQVDQAGIITTNQPSRPEIQETTYEFTADGKLVLVFAGEKSTYVRVSHEAA